MSQVILYRNDFGQVAVVFPVPGSGLSTEQLALRDVPAGRPFVIAEDTDLPVDPKYQAAWTVDFSTPDGVGLGYAAWKELQDGGN